MSGELFLGFHVDPETMEETGQRFTLKPSHLTTHGVIIGMTGSGKTGAAIVMIEELLLNGIPVIAIDPKGDLANLALRFPQLRPEDFEPWIDKSAARAAGLSTKEYAEKVANTWRNGLERAGITGRLKELVEKSEVLVLTPGSRAATPLSILEGLRPPKNAGRDILEERAKTTAAALLRLAGLEGGDEEVFLANLLLWAWEEGREASLDWLIASILKPPFDKIGVLDLDMVLPEKKRRSLAVSLNRVIASPGFSDWLTGLPLDIDTLLWTPDGRPRAVVVYLAHLDDSYKMFATTLVLQTLYTWMYTKGGSDRLRALLYFDEVYGFIPPHPANPPTKRLLMLLAKQARAFGLGLVLATQNPVDIDYKVLTNTGVWMIGRLQTENDIDRVSDGLRIATGSGEEARRQIPRLPKRVFIVKDVKKRGLELFKTRWAMTYLRGPLTLRELERLPKTSIPTPSVRHAAEKPPIDLLNAPPLVNQAFDQAFIPGNGEYYEPLLAARAHIYVSKTRPPIDLERTIIAYADPQKTEFKSPEEAGLPETLIESSENTWTEGIGFKNLPPIYAKKTFYNKLKSLFARYAVAKATIELFYSPIHREYSKPGEKREEFEKRLREKSLKMAREEAEKIASRYNAKIERLKTRLQSKRAQIEKTRGEIANLKAELGLAGVSALASLTRLTSALSKVSRTQRLRRRIASKEATLRKYESEAQSLLTQIEKLEKEKEEKIKKIMEKYTSNITLKTVKIKPARKDVDIDFLGILWIPKNSDNH